MGGCLIVTRDEGCVPQGVQEPHRGDGVESGVGTNAEVGAGDVVGDGGGDDADGDTELLKLGSPVHQLQAAHEGLEEWGVRGTAPGGALQPHATPLTSKPPMMISPWMPKVLMVALISSKYFLGKVLAEAWEGKASGGGLCLGPRTQISKGQRYLFVPSLDPPRPVQPPTISQLISSTWQEGRWGENSSEKAGLGGKRRVVMCTTLSTQQVAITVPPCMQGCAVSEAPCWVGSTVLGAAAFRAATFPVRSLSLCTPIPMHPHSCASSVHSHPRASPFPMYPHPYTPPFPVYFLSQGIPFPRAPPAPMHPLALALSRRRAPRSRRAPPASCAHG